jgi:type I restriction enzyme S subunit
LAGQASLDGGVMRRYPAYKDSGVEWLGELPEGWNVVRLKHACNVFPSNVDKHTVEGEIPVSLCNYTDVYYRETITPDIEFMQATARPDEIERFSLQIGDVIFTKDSETADDIGIAALVKEELPGVVCGYHLSIARPRRGVSGPFVKRYFDSRFAKACFQVSANGLTRVGLGQSAIDNVAFPLPPLPEQTAIAVFLDRETAKIDALVGEQRRLIDLLKEKRQAVISHAVTKGLNPNAPLKPSGIDWLGDVPEGWEVCGIKFVCTRITDGAHISPETENGAFPFVSTKDVSETGIDFENCLQTSETTYRYMVATGCQPTRGDILFSKDGTIGRTVIVANDVDFVVASSLIIIRPNQKQCSTDFLNYLCQSSAVNNQVASFVKGAGLPRLSITNLLKVFGVFPSRDEQVEIATHLDEVTAKFDTLTATAETAITLLQERRAALISAAVTGKIDVRHLATTEVEAA